MLGSDLHILASVADLTKTDLDPTAGRVTLSTSHRPGYLTAQYYGSYTAACVWVAVSPDEVGAIECAVEARRFAAVAKLFSDGEDVRVHMKGSGLVLETAAQHVLLGTGASEGIMPLPDDLEVYTTVDRARLVAELSLALEFTAKSIAKPVLTGARVSVTETGAVRMTSFNGFSLAYAASLPGHGEGRACTFITPEREAGPCLGVLRGEETAVACKLVDGVPSMVVLQGEQEWVRLVLYVDDQGWPHQMLDILRQDVDRQVVSLPVDRLKLMLTAAKALDSYTSIRVSGGGEGEVLFQPAAGEAGRYVASVPGVLDGEYWYSADDMSLATRVGSELTLEIAAAGSVPALVRGKGRRLWMATRAPAGGVA